MKQQLAILFGVSSDHAFALANVLMGLARHSPAMADRIIVYHDRLSEQDQRLLNALIPCEFRVYEFPCAQVAWGGAELSFARFEAFRLLEDFHNVLWLDLDTLIRGDLSGMLDFRGTGIAMREEPAPVARLFPEPARRTPELERYDLDRCFFNAGVLLVSDVLQEPSRLAEWCYDLVRRQPEWFSRYWDQGALNLMIQEFGIRVTPLPPVYNNMICRDYRDFYRYRKDALIVHSITRKKFWNYWRFPEWDRCYREWLAMGGSAHRAMPMSGLRFLADRVTLVFKRLRKRSSRYRHWRTRAGR